MTPAPVGIQGRPRAGFGADHSQSSHVSRNGEDRARLAALVATSRRDLKERQTLGTTELGLDCLNGRVEFLDHARATNPATEDKSHACGAIKHRAAIVLRIAAVKRSSGEVGPAGPSSDGAGQDRTCVSGCRRVFCLKNAGSPPARRRQFRGGGEPPKSWTLSDSAFHVLCGPFERLVLSPAA